MTDQNQVSLELRHLGKSYGSTLAVDDVSLITRPGEFITLLGPSGSGKTTTLNLIAGFLKPDVGDILVDGTSIRALPPHKRNIGLVFQDYLLFPHMTSAKNVAFPLRRRNVPKPEIDRKVDEALELVGLAGLGSRFPRELSGGQQQRVALARAIVYDPPILLMDEPLGALDKSLRERMQVEIRRIHRELGTTFIYVTHDQSEALALSDRIAVFNGGKIEQLGTASEIYETPTTTFVASFIGESNIIHGEAARDGSGLRLVAGPWALTLPTSTETSGSTNIVLRPENVRLATGDTQNTVRGRLIETVYLGASRRISVDVPGVGQFIAYEAVDSGPVAEPGSEVDLTWKVEDVVVLADGVEPIQAAGNDEPALPVNQPTDRPVETRNL